MDAGDWIDVGDAAELARRSLQRVQVGRMWVALSHENDTFGAVADGCNHVGGPLGEGRLDGEYVVCPWHAWKFHRITGLGEPGYEADRVPSFAVKVEGGRVWVNAVALTSRNRSPHKPHPLARPPNREDGPSRVLGISTTAMDPAHPRYSTSEALLESALQHAAAEHEAETRLLRLRDLSFRSCEGYYSKSARACTWPCSITQMDKKDELAPVYEGLVHWADVVLVSTPIRWGAASALYYKMVERMNCIQNQITTHGRVLLQNKVAAFIITGGQDNVQAVAGQMLGFFAEIGLVFPPFPYVAHSRGWSAEDMERNVEYVQQSESLRSGTRALVDRALDLSHTLLQAGRSATKLEKGGRKACRPGTLPQPAQAAEPAAGGAES